MQEAYEFAPIILREYDIRGQIGKNLGPEDAYALGLAFGTFVRRRGGKEKVTICVGYDGRHSSPELSESLIKGLMKSGSDVKMIGLGPTPMLYFTVKDLHAEAGVMITGSHNPSDYNGFKMTLQDGPVFGALIQEIGALAAAGDFERGDGTLERLDVKDRYVARLLQDFTGGRPLKVAWDAGNGAAGEILKKLTDQLPGEHIVLFDEIDGDFPNHHPDPTVDKNLIDLQRAVTENGCDLGIAFDGDGDRIGVIDEKGTVLRCDILMTIYAREVLRNHSGAAIIGDVKCSQVMFDEIARLGGQPIMWKTGHSLIKDKIAETGAPLAGELSGHIFFADKYYGFDDALYCAVRLLNDVCESDGALSSLTKDLPVLFNTPEIRIEVDGDEKFQIVPRIIENLKNNLPAGMALDDIDGVRISNNHGWWLLRPSNTQDVLVCRAEADSEEHLERLKQMILQEVEKVGYSIDFPA
ncbi:MAG: phosphomannomutase/phosphoglucomutase [Alphaproteobacteria bacterium]|nr:phosphomannomutase/phosphoglucomutase [Alphaproteobacteria bacterium]